MWWIKLSFFLLGVSYQIKSCISYPSGSPTSACASLTPVHKNILPQQSRPPYTIKVSQNKYKVKVEVQPERGYDIQGFILQARSSRDPDRHVEGKFSTVKDISKTINCFSGYQNTLTHTSKVTKDRIVTEWTPNADVYEEVVFRATVALGYDRFWTGVDSLPLKIQGGPNTEENNAESFGSTNSAYDGCHISKGCYGYPSDCVSSRNCDILISYADAGDGIMFTMNELTSGSPGYMAVGISKDRFMGSDSVMACYVENGRVIAQPSWNEGRTNQPQPRLDPGRYEYQLNDGSFSCSWKRPYVTSVNDTTFDLLDSTYNLLIAKGLVSGGRIQFHFENFLASMNKVNFTAFEEIQSQGVHDAIKIHGTFMVTAWVGFVSLGILMARHFKSVWEKRTICGVKVWFAFHRGLMIMALGFAAIAFIVIFIYKKGWDNPTENPHAVLGCIAMAFGFCQPIMAAFRPGVDDPKRPIFNWLHYAVGNVGQIIAIVTIFFARRLAGSGLKDSFYWVMAVFVVVHCFFHFVFQLHAWTLQKRRNNEIKMLEMADGTTRLNSSDHREKTISGNVFRVLLLGVYGIFLAVIVVALYALIGGA